jgi:tetratricopeptide (TPR) repeat protein
MLRPRALRPNPIMEREPDDHPAPVPEPEKKPRRGNSTLDQGIEALEKKQYDQAIQLFTEVIKRNSRSGDAYFHRGIAYLEKDDYPSALADLDQSIALDGGRAAAFSARAWVHHKQDHDALALSDCKKALSIDPETTDAYTTRGSIYEKRKQYDKARADYEKACQTDAQDPDPRNALAWLLATCPEERIRNGALALMHARRACELSNNEDHAFLDTLAAAYAESRLFEDAVLSEEQALRLVTDPKERAEYQARLELYRAGKPFRSN